MVNKKRTVKPGEKVEDSGIYEGTKGERKRHSLKANVLRLLLRRVRRTSRRLILTLRTSGHQTRPNCSSRNPSDSLKLIRT
jgi:hypothetical protein